MLNLPVNGRIFHSNSITYIFGTIEDVQEAATTWVWTYNNERPNMAIGGITPK
jgi:hypothetical protein